MAEAYFAAFTGISSFGLVVSIIHVEEMNLFGNLLKQLANIVFFCFVWNSLHHQSMIPIRTMCLGHGRKLIDYTQEG